MTQIVYWSPWYLESDRKDLDILYDEPDALMTDMNKNRNKLNNDSNWFRCHSVLNEMKNTFILRSPMSYDFVIHKEFGIVKVNPLANQTSVAVDIRPASILNATTLSIYNNWIFWSDEPLKMTQTPAFMHQPSFNGYMVPGSFDIGRWFRPLEAAIQLHKDVDYFNVQRGEPFGYVKFDTDEPVILKRFYMTDEIVKLSVACINYKFSNPSRPLSYLYSKFKTHGLQRRISEEIQKNLLGYETKD